jgi:hypothetical protein
MRKKEILSCDETFNQLLLKDRRFQLTLTSVKKARRQLFAQQNQSQCCSFNKTTLLQHPINTSTSVFYTTPGDQS